MAAALAQGHGIAAQRTDTLTEIVGAFRLVERSLVPRIVPAYREALGDCFYRGGWSSSPSYPEKTYADYASWLASGARGDLTNREICVIGSNKLWALIESLSGSALSDYSRNSGRSGHLSTEPNRGLIAGISLRIPCEDLHITVYGGKNRSSLDDSSTYDDKFIEINADARTYRIRAVDTKADGSSSSASVREYTGGAAILRDPESDVAELLPRIHRGLQSGASAPTLHLFDRGLTLSAVSALASTLKELDT